MVADVIPLLSFADPNCADLTAILDKSPDRIGQIDLTVLCRGNGPDLGEDLGPKDIPSTDRETAAGYTGCWFLDDIL